MIIIYNWKSQKEVLNNSLTWKQWLKMAIMSCSFREKSFEIYPLCFRKLSLWYSIYLALIIESKSVAVIFVGIFIIFPLITVRACILATSYSFLSHTTFYHFFIQKTLQTEISDTRNEFPSAFIELFIWEETS